MDAVFYWDMTYAEIITAINANNKKLERDWKENLQAQAIIAYKLGELIGIALNDPKKYPANVEEAFPKIFDDIKSDGPSKQQDWQIMKARIEQYNYLHKQKRGEKA